METVKTPTSPDEHLAIVASWPSDAIQFCADVKLELRDWQAPVLRRIQGKRRVVLRVPRGGGKTALLARKALHALATGARVVIVAPIRSQLDLLHREIESALRSSRLQALYPEWRLFVDTLETGVPTIALSFLSAETGASLVEGIHGSPVTLIVDEAKSVPDDVRISLEPMLIGPDARFIAASTAGNGVGWFDRAFSSEWGLWDEHISIPVEECPGLIEKAEEMRKMLGKTHPAFRSMYLNEPGIMTAAEPFFDASRVEQAIALPLDPPANAPVVWSVDVARYGSDASVVARRKGGAIRALVSWQKADTMSTVGRIFEMLRAADEKPTSIIIDAAGVGGGVSDRLRELLEERGVLARYPISIVDFVGGQRAPYDEEFFGNWKTWCAHIFAGMLERGQISLPSGDSGLVQDLCSYERVTTSSGKSRIKDPARSPDRGDAVLMLFAKGITFGPSIVSLSRDPAIKMLLGLD